MYKKIFFAFTSLTLAASVAALACEKHGDHHMDDNSQYETSNANHDNASVQYIPARNAQGRLVCVPVTSNADNSVAQPEKGEVKTLGYLQPGSVLPTPKVAYDYEKVRQKELNAKKKRHSPAKKAKIKKSPDAYQETPSQANDMSKSAPKSSAVMEDDSKIKTGDATAAGNSMPSTEPSMAGNPTATKPANTIVPTPVPAPAQVPTPVLPSNEMKIPHETGNVPLDKIDTKPALESSTTAPTASAPVMSRMTALDYSETEVELSADNQAVLDQVATDLKSDTSKNIKIQSYGYSSVGNSSDARRNSFQRAIKIRKYLIDKEVNAARISVNALEDANNKLNRVEIMFEESK